MAHDMANAYNTVKERFFRVLMIPSQITARRIQPRKKNRLLGFLLLSFSLLGFAGPVSNAGEWRVTEPAKAGESPQWFNAPLPWARPLSDGRIDALLLAPWDALRDAVELETRVDLRLARVGYREAGTTDTSSAELLDGLLDEGPDVVILGNIEFETLPSDFLEKIIAQVNDGLGLVVYRFNGEKPSALEALFGAAKRLQDNAEIIRGLGSGFVPAWRDGFDFASLYEYGEGRVADIAYESKAPFMHAFVPAPDGPGNYSETLAFEDHMSLAARAVLWSAHRSREARIAKATVQLPAGPPEDEIPPFLPREYVKSLSDATLRQGLIPVRIELDAPAKRTYDLAYSLRFPSRALSWERAVERFPRGRSSTLIHVPVGQGSFLVDVWLRDSKGVVDWFTADTTLPGWPEIFDVKFSKHSVRENDELTITLQLRPHFNRPRQSTVLFRAMDGWERVVAERYVPVAPEAGTVTALLSFSDLLSPFLRIDVFAADVPSGQFGPFQLPKSGHAFMALPVHLKPRRAFRFAAAGTGAFERNARGQNLALAELGVDTVAVSNASTAAVAPVADNLLIAPRVAAYGHPNPNDTYCLTDPDFLVNELDRLHDLALSYGALGSTMYTIASHDASHDGPEDSRGHVCRSETCALGLEAMLKDSFPSLAELNQSWGTRYARWDAVLPSDALPHKDAPVSQWLDSQLYRDRVLMNARARAIVVIRAADPEASVATVIEDSTRSGPGPDWRQLAARMDTVVAPDSSVAIEKLRSYASGDTRTLLAINPGSRERAGLPWRAVLNGFDGIWIAGADSRPPSVSVEDALTPDGRPLPWIERIAAEVQDLRAGYDHLFAKATREAANIAVYDSRASRHINSLRPIGLASSDDSEAALASALNELGYPFDFVSSEDALAGALDNYKAVLLPMLTALSDSELAVLRNFAEAGGLLVADLRPGSYNEHGALRPNVPLTAMFAPEESENKEDRKSVWTVQRESGLFSALLNEPFPILDHADELVSELDRMLAESGAVKVGDNLLVDAEGLRGERAAYRYSEARILAFTNTDDGESKERQFRVRPTKEMFPYASRRGELLDGGKRHKFRLRPGDVEVIAFLPYEVTRILLEVPETIRRGRHLPIGIDVRTRDKLPGNHVVYVTLTPRAGKPIAYYSHSLECVAGHAVTSIPLALNETPGEYTVTIRDTLTGFVETATVNVAP